MRMVDWYSQSPTLLGVSLKSLAGPSVPCRAGRMGAPYGTGRHLILSLLTASPCLTIVLKGQLSRVV